MPISKVIESKVPKDSSYSILVAGHAYGSPNYPTLEIYKPLIDYFDLHLDEMDHIVFTGDIVRNSEPIFWDWFQEYMDGLNKPFLIAPGNHDMGDRKLFYNYFGDIQKVSYIGIDALVTLDNTLNGWAIDQHQQELIEQALEAEGRLFIFVHNVWWHDFSDCFSPNSYAGIAPDTLQNFKTELLPLLLASKKEVFVIAGDVGATQKSYGAGVWQKENLTLLTSGMGNGKTDNVLKLDVSKDEVSYRFIPLVGDTIIPCLNF